MVGRGKDRSWTCNFNPGQAQGWFQKTRQPLQLFSMLIKCLRCPFSMLYKLNVEVLPKKTCNIMQHSISNTDLWCWKLRYQPLDPFPNYSVLAQEMDVSKNREKTPKMDEFIMENPIRMDDLGVPLFLETPKCLSSFLSDYILVGSSVDSHEKSLEFSNASMLISTSQVPRLDHSSKTCTNNARMYCARYHVSLRLL